MINFKSNKAVTLVILIVMIIVLLIIAGITITLSIDSITKTINTQDISEMLIMQHAMQERYMEYTQTNDESVLVGEKVYPNTTRDSDEFYIYEISRDTKLNDLLDNDDKADKVYYICYNKDELTSTLVYVKNDDLTETQIELKEFRNSINFKNSNTHSEEEVILDDIKYTNKYQVDWSETTVNSLKMLGVVGQGVDKSDYLVNYKTGSIEELGTSKKIDGYNKEIPDDTGSNRTSTTSNEIEI